MYYYEFENNDWCVFNTDDIGRFKSGHCFATFSTEEQAKNEVDKLNKKY